MSIFLTMVHSHSIQNSWIDWVLQNVYKIGGNSSIANVYISSLSFLTPELNLPHLHSSIPYSWVNLIRSLTKLSKWWYQAPINPGGSSRNQILGRRTGAQFPMGYAQESLKKVAQVKVTYEATKLGKAMYKTLSSKISFLTWHYGEVSGHGITHQGTAKDTNVYITLFKFLKPRAHGQKWFVTTY